MEDLKDYYNNCSRGEQNSIYEKLLKKATIDKDPFSISHEEYKNRLSQAEKDILRFHYLREEFEAYGEC